MNAGKLEHIRELAALLKSDLDINEDANKIIRLVEEGQITNAYWTADCLARTLYMLQRRAARLRTVVSDAMQEETRKRAISKIGEVALEDNE